MYSITEKEASSLKDFIRYNFIKYIRKDEEVDSLLYIRNIINIYDRLGGLKEDYDDYELSNK